MRYRRLGESGLKLSVLSLGSWLTFGGQMDGDDVAEVLSVAHQAGVNFFDNAEEYGMGLSESMMGAALRDLALPRHSYVISTKFYWGIHGGPNTQNTLNRKYLTEAIDPSLERLGLGHVDLVFCHRYDPDTPVEEVVWAMSDLISRGKAHYWGTSKWPADKIREACEVAERHRLRKPTMEQAEYSLLRRHRVEAEYAAIHDELGIGITTFSPLEKGLLTGKYLDGDTAGTRADLVPRLSAALTDRTYDSGIAEFKEVAADVGCTPSQLALAWAMGNPRVTSVITGVSRVSQLVENLEAVALLETMEDGLRDRVEAIFQDSMER